MRKNIKSEKNRSDFEISGWNLSNEREFVENIFHGRFNYFLLVYSLALIAGFANNFTSYKSVVFFAGGVMLLMVWPPLYRVYEKQDLILQILYNNFPEHPVSKIEELRKEYGHKDGVKVSQSMGFPIPFVCITSLFFLGIVTAAGLLV